MWASSPRLRWGTAAHPFESTDTGRVPNAWHVRTLARVDVQPLRMEPELLDRLPTDPLTDADQAALRAWVADPNAPDKELADALLRAGRKAEQEGGSCGYLPRC